MPEALIVWGGWQGHEPEKGANIVRDILESEGSEAIWKPTHRPSATLVSPGST